MGAPCGAGAPVHRRIRCSARLLPGFGGLVEGAGPDVDADRFAGQLAERGLEFGAVVEQARAGVREPGLVAGQHALAEAFLGPGPEVQVRGGGVAVDLAEIRG